MEIELKHLIPLPLTETDTRQSEIWQQKSVVFGTAEKVLLYAGSGKGKTTLLSIIYGLRRDYRGKAVLNGRDIRELSEKERSTLRKEKLSFVFQGLELFDDLSALENIHLKNRQKDFKTENEIKHLALSLEIDTILHRQAGILSFGQRQRVAIIRALCQPFAYLLADEIFSHLDKRIRAISLEILKKELDDQKAGLLFTRLDETEDPFFTHKYRI